MSIQNQYLHEEYILKLSSNMHIIFVLLMNVAMTQCITLVKNAIRIRKATIFCILSQQEKYKNSELTFLKFNASTRIKFPNQDKTLCI